MKVYTSLLLLSVLPFVGCSNDNEMTSKVEDDAIVTITSVQPIDDTQTTRFATQSTDDRSAPYIHYEIGDEIGIFPTTIKSNGESQIKFTIKDVTDNDGKDNSATINAGSWKTFEGHQYIAYLPYSLTDDPTIYKVNYLGQEQCGNFNADHMSKYTYMASTPADAALDEATGQYKFKFTPKNLSSTLRFKLTVPESKTYTKMVFTSNGDNEDFTLVGSIDLLDTDNNQPLTSTQTSKSMALTLKDKSSDTGITVDKDVNGILTLYLALAAPTQLTGNSYTITLYTSDGYYYTYESPLSNLSKLRQRNYAATISVPESGYSWSEAIENNELGTLIGKVN